MMCIIVAVALIGIALPNALYVMEGIAEVLRRREERGR